MAASNRSKGFWHIPMLLEAVILLVISQVFCADNSSFITQERRLYKDLMKNYVKSIRPARNASDNVTVRFGLSILNIADVDLKTHTLSLNVWADEVWNEPQLSWDPNLYGGVKSLQIPAASLWKPDITLYNNFGDTYTQEANAVVLNTGVVYYVPYMRLKSYCSYDLTRFPYDTQECTLLFGSWVYDESMLDIQLNGNSSENYVSLASFREHHEWNVTMASGRRDVIKYPCCAHGFAHLTFTLTMKRLTTYYTYVYVTPCMLLNLLLPLMFLLPPETRQKTTLGIGIFIGYSILLLMLEMTLPSAFSYVPLIAMVYVTGMILVTISLGIGVLTTCCWEYAPRAKREMPPLLKTVFLGWLARVLCVNRDSYTPHQPDVSTIQQMSQLQMHDPVQELENGAFDVNDRYNVLTVPRVHDVISADWRALAVTVDRLLFVVFLVVNLVLTIVL
ncbi:neuronal acetylcholine receptor subunit alpha-3 isoform X2 [Lingula anatina]|uniref:Neuronal acetylcholine receptor subunit alpha-3 isoform X2 n=1 Tax=Lingula anatina TaxID=7574 RepID=A0A1S3JHP8_LINAN|nr:neuronal acetylcholine receptor subunit alpha-3 isoform X2 [Lingula anatina]|eukprot:XP_013409424.1 neuronal acetylcholine receptor subunit alpha-3 isoform X2 [Lingula anatina]